MCHKSKNSLTITDPSCICQAHLCCWTQLDEPQKNKGQLVPTVSDGYRLSENQCVDIQAMKTVTLSIHTALWGSKGSRSSFLVVKIRKESQKRLKALCLGGILSSKMGRRKRRWQGNDCRRDTEAACPAACSSLLSQCLAERRHITSHYWIMNSQQLCLWFRDIFYVGLSAWTSVFGRVGLELRCQLLN